MYSLAKMKRGQLVGKETIRWIIYIAIAIVVGFSVRLILRKASG